jgi:outer membrane lipoprotein-sorting protein
MVPLRSTLAALMLVLVSHSVRGTEPADRVHAWLAAQQDIRTWTAEFIQVRTLKTLTQPLASQGRVWFSAPDRFRWELGDPAQTIAVRQPGQMLVIYPLLRRAERYPLDGQASGPWRDALALLEAGFPRNQQELEKRFRITAQTIEDGTVTVALEPKSASARRLMPRLRIGFGDEDLLLRFTELHFADGSTMRNNFQKPDLNIPIRSELFAPELGADYKIVEPLQK